MSHDDPNSATKNQNMIKRVERSIRRRCDCNLYLLLDGVALKKDEEEIKSDMLLLKSKLESGK